MLGELLALVVTVSSVASREEPAGCAIAVAWVKRMLRENPDDYMFEPDRTAFWDESFTPSRQFPVTIDGAFRETIATTPRRNAVEACPSLRRELEANGIPFLRSEVDAATWVDDPNPMRSTNERYERRLVALDLPVLNDTGDEAFLQVTISANARFSISQSYIVGRPDWVIVLRRPGPVS